jgi:hypothetical protein
VGAGGGLANGQNQVEGPHHVSAGRPGWCTGCAIASKDDDRILASAKQVLSILEKEKPATTTKSDYLDVQLLTEEEFLELGLLLDPLTAFKKRALARIANDVADIARLEGRAS